MATFQNLTVGTLTVTGDRASDVGPIVLNRDKSGNATQARGTTVPANSGSGYAVGCLFTKTDAATGQCATWINQGTATSCAFRPIGPVLGYGVAKAFLSPASAGGDATEIIAAHQAGLRASDLTFIDHGVNGAATYVCGQVVADGIITVTQSADPSTGVQYSVAALRNGCIPEWDIFAAGTVATAGGSAAEAITVAGVLPGDMALVTYSATDDTDTIAKAVCTANTITVTMSADPSTTHGLHYVVLRPRGSFKPSHYIFAAANYTTVGGNAAEAITVSGALATDVAIVHYHTTNDTDKILKAVVTADTLTVTMSADPSTAHKLNYMLLRAYA